MKSIFRMICSVFFATSIAFPANVLATQLEDLDDPTEEHIARSDQPDQYNLAFLTGDFGLRLSSAEMPDQYGSLVMFLSDPAGKIVKNAQVITTIIDNNGNQQMLRAKPFRGGYLVNTAHLSSGQYRLETEIIADGWLLTDEFCFRKA